MKTEDALKLAQELVTGPRAKTYGDKIRNHANIGKMWSAYLDKEITAHDAAVMLALLKVARTKFGEPTEDTYVDAAAYMAIAISSYLSRFGKSVGGSHSVCGLNKGVFIIFLPFFMSL